MNFIKFCLRKLPIIFILQGLFGQYVDVHVNLDLKQIRENEKYIFDTFSDDIENYLTSTEFLEGADDMEMTLDIHVIIESITSSDNARIVNSQIVISNRVDQQFFAKGVDFPYSKGKSLNYTMMFEPFASFFDYIAYIFLASELDTYDYLSGDAYFVKAEEISMNGKRSDYTRGWEDRWKKCRKLKDNSHLRSVRYYYFVALDELYSKVVDGVYIDEPDKKTIINALESCHQSFVSLDEMMNVDRNTRLFLKAYASDLSKLYHDYNMKNEIEFLLKIDPDNESIYLQYLK